MKKPVLGALLALAAFGALAQNGSHPAPAPAGKSARACHDCATVQQVHKEKRKGEGGAVGIVAGAAAGGLLGNQIGGGSGKTLATVAGAVGGGFAGNEIQKHVTAKEVWVTRVRFRDGSERSFAQEAPPAWKAGSVVRVSNGQLARL